VMREGRSGMGECMLYNLQHTFTTHSQHRHSHSQHTRSQHMFTTHINTYKTRTRAGHLLIKNKALGGARRTQKPRFKTTHRSYRSVSDEERLMERISEVTQSLYQTFGYLRLCPLFNF